MKWCSKLSEVEGVGWLPTKAAREKAQRELEESRKKMIDQEALARYHRRIANHLLAKCDTGGGGTWLGGDPRAYTHMARHFLAAGHDDPSPSNEDLDQLSVCYSSLRFLHGALRFCPRRAQGVLAVVRPLLKWYKGLQANTVLSQGESDLVADKVDRLAPVAEFVRKHEKALSLDPSRMVLLASETPAMRELLEWELGVVRDMIAGGLEAIRRIDGILQSPPEGGLGQEEALLMMARLGHVQLEIQAAEEFGLTELLEGGACEDLLCLKSFNFSCTVHLR
eukprot:CAMPEP_0169436124 /NCGR_PEP_ID=MMETSP1042-20121227/5426_1 /TAXON_ID=464988 /ORGANISM="Hemiselmis andersenii, Strain CCMP1180" /LENGTH=279 /DNA_ID=CAMNT_0009546807 /DNA_START=70 /DNA_END=906 /DNA_ORIENTATION=+